MWRARLGSRTRRGGPPAAGRALVVRPAVLDCHPPPAARANTHPSSMDEEETYMFDTQGYVILRDVLTASELAALNAGGCC